jgi:predicted small metal-binding protein
MSVSSTCKGCGLKFTAENEGGLADQVLAHITEAHASGHTPTREQVLAIIRKRLATTQD